MISPRRMFNYYWFWFKAWLSPLGDGLVVEWKICEQKDAIQTDQTELHYLVMGQLDVGLTGNRDAVFDDLWDHCGDG